jgi:hypothetical protein
VGKDKENSGYVVVQNKLPSGILLKFLGTFYSIELYIFNTHVKLSSAEL